MGSKLRINITVDSETMRLADRLARRSGTSRSAILREGVRALAQSREHQAEQEERRQQARKAIQEIRRLARKAGDWPTDEILHPLRYRLETKK